MASKDKVSGEKSGFRCDSAGAGLVRTLSTHPSDVLLDVEVQNMLANLPSLGSPYVVYLMNEGGESSADRPSNVTHRIVDHQPEESVYSLACAGSSEPPHVSSMQTCSTSTRGAQATDKWCERGRDCVFCAEKQAQASKVNDKMGAYRHEVNKLTEQLKESNQQILSKEFLIEEFAAKMRNLIRENVHLVGLYEEKQRDLEELTPECNRLQYFVDRALSTTATDRKAISDLEDELYLLREEKSNVELALRMTTTERDIQDQNCRFLQKEVNAMMRRHTDLESELQDLNSAMSILSFQTANNNEDIQKKRERKSSIEASDGKKIDLNVKSFDSSLLQGGVLNKMFNEQFCNESPRRQSSVYSDRTSSLPKVFGKSASASNLCSNVESFSDMNLQRYFAGRIHPKMRTEIAESLSNMNLRSLFGDLSSESVISSRNTESLSSLDSKRLFNDISEKTMFAKNTEGQSNVNLKGHLGESSSDLEDVARIKCEHSYSKQPTTNYLAWNYDATPKPSTEHCDSFRMMPTPATSDCLLFLESNNLTNAESWTWDFDITPKASMDFKNSFSMMPTPKGSECLLSLNSQSPKPSGINDNGSAVFEGGVIRRMFDSRAELTPRGSECFDGGVLPELFHEDSNTNVGMQPKVSNDSWTTDDDSVSDSLLFPSKKYQVKVKQIGKNRNRHKKHRARHLISRRRRNRF